MYRTAEIREAERDPLDTYVRAPEPTKVESLIARMRNSIRVKKRSKAWTDEDTHRSMVDARRKFLKAVVCTGIAGALSLHNWDAYARIHGGAANGLSPAGAAPLIIGLDDTNGPVAGTNGSENGQGAYFTIFGMGLGSYADYQSGANTVTVGGKAVHDVRCLTPMPGTNYAGIWCLTVQVGALSGLTINGTTAYPVVVTVGGQTPSNPLVSGFYQTLDGSNASNIQYTPNNTDFCVFVQESTGTDPTIGTAPTGAYSTGGGGFGHGVKNWQTSTGASFGGALTMPTSPSSTPSAASTTPPGTKIYGMGEAVYANYLTGTLGATQNYRQICPYVGTGSPNHSIQLSRYPGPAGANTPAVVQFIPPTSSASTANGGGIHGTDSTRATFANSFNSTGFGQYFSVSLLYVAPNTLTLQTDGGPINTQNNAWGWRIWGNEVTWPTNSSTQYLTGGLQLVGTNIWACCNYIHDIFDSGTNQENHGIYCGDGGGVALVNSNISFNEIKNITNPSGVGVAKGGNGIQLHNGHVGTFYTGITIHHNWINTTIKYGSVINNDGGGNVQVDYWCNVYWNVQQKPFYLAFSTGGTLAIRHTNETFIGCNGGDLASTPYGGTNYTFVWNNGSGSGTNTCVFENCLFVQASGAPTYGGLSFDNSGATFQFINCYFFDYSGQYSTAPTGVTIANPQLTTSTFAFPLGLTIPSLKPTSGSPLLNKGTTPTNIGFTPLDALLNPMLVSPETKNVIGALHS